MKTKTRGKCHPTTVASPVMALRAEEHQGLTLLLDTRRRKEGFCLKPQREHGAADTLASHICLQNCGEMHFCCFKLSIYGT